ncbi:MAG: hypothetical protein WA510_28935 [Acidobacteriaceae bacterium]
MNYRQFIVITGFIIAMAVALGLRFAPAAAGQAADFQVNVIYQCAPPLSAKAFSCTGTAPTASCDVQNYRDGKPTQRGALMRQPLAAGLQKCHVQTADEAKAHPPGPDLPASAANGANRPAGVNAAAGANQVGAGGFKVGDTVRLPLGDGKILPVRGSEYVVRNANGVEIWMSYPAQIKRVGKLTAQDHALGQYDAHDPVQVLVEGKWLDGEVVRQSDNVFSVKLPNGNEVDTSAQFMRASTAPPPAPKAPAFQPGQPPKPGLASCAGKFEGRYASAAGTPGMVTIVFRSGKATLREPDMVMTNGKLSAMSSEKEAECWTGGGKIYLKWIDGSDYDFPIDINDDGTRSTLNWAN